MKLIFTLTMPGNNAWNGRWSGEGKLYAKVVDVGTAKKTREKYAAILGKCFGYNFGDGWYASVSVREPVDAKDLRDVRKRSAGFCGYDWIINDIRFHGKILTHEEREALKNPVGVAQ